MGFLWRDFERDHLAEKSYWTKMGQKSPGAVVITLKKRSESPL
jgi:hypothetical protein